MHKQKHVKKGNISDRPFIKQTSAASTCWVHWGYIGFSWASANVAEWKGSRREKHKEKKKVYRI